MTCFFSASYSYWWRWLHMLQRKVCENISTARWLLSFLATWQFASLLPPCPGFRWIAQKSVMSFIPHIFLHNNPRLRKLTVAAVFYQATSSRSCFWKQRYSYVYLILVLETKICQSYLYLLQYFFLAFFFCLNAIAINTYLPFSMISATFQKVQQNLNI